MAGLTATEVLLGAIFVAVWSSCRSKTVTLVAFKNESVTFTCRSNGTSLYWRRTAVAGLTQQIFSDTTYLVKQSADLYQLTILSVGQQTVAKYFVSNKELVDMECEYELSVIDVVADVSSESDVITIGDNVTVKCGVTVYSRVEASMTFCAIDVIINDNRGQNVSHSHELLSCQSAIYQKVVSVNSTISQKGYVQYFCTVVTQNGSQTFNTTKLQVSYPVQNVAINRPNNSLLLLDEVISCSADAFPPVFQYHWQEFDFSSNKWLYLGNRSQFAVKISGMLSLRCIASNIVKNIIYNSTSDVFYFNVLTMRASSTSSSAVTSTNISQANIPLIVGLCVGLGGLLSIVIIIIVIAACCATRRQQKQQSKAGGAKNGTNKRNSEVSEVTLVENSVYEDHEIASQALNKATNSINNDYSDIEHKNGNTPFYTTVDKFAVDKSKENVKSSPMHSKTSASKVVQHPSTSLTLFDNAVYDTSAALQSPAGDNSATCCEDPDFSIANKKASFV